MKTVINNLIINIFKTYAKKTTLISTDKDFPSSKFSSKDQEVI